MTVACRRCGARWAGLRIEHCASCHATFAATAPGDAHRIGRFDVSADDPQARRCRTPDEMRALGLWSTANPYGVAVWHGRVSRTGQPVRREFP